MCFTIHISQRINHSQSMYILSEHNFVLFFVHKVDIPECAFIYDRDESPSFSRQNRMCELFLHIKYACHRRLSRCEEALVPQSRQHHGTVVVPAQSAFLIESLEPNCIVEPVTVTIIPNV